jgi:sialidase-1
MTQAECTTAFPTSNTTAIGGSRRFPRCLTNPSASANGYYLNRAFPKNDWCRGVRRAGNCLLLACVLSVLHVTTAAQAAMSVSVSTTFNYVATNGGAGGYEAFPDVTRLADGRLMTVFYEGYTHISPPTGSYPNGGRIMYATSATEGATWSAPSVLCDTPIDDRDPSIAQLSDGRLFCTYFTYANGQGQGTYLIQSGNAGATWSTPQQLSAGYYTSSPVRQLSSNRLALGTYSESNGVAHGAVTLSDDGGTTWTTPIDIPNPSGAYLDAETDLIELTTGSLWAVQRSSHSSAQFSTSNDDGSTWSDSQPLGFVAHSPYLLRTDRGSMILMAYRGYDSLDGWGTGYTALRYSLDECTTWSDPIVVDTCVGAYPSMVNLNDDSVLVTYYEEGGGSNIRSRVITISGVPEPSSIVLLATGLGGLGSAAIYRRFSRKRRGHKPVQRQTRLGDQLPYSRSGDNCRLMVLVAVLCMFVAGFAQAAETPQKDLQVQAVNFEEKVIYHSPESPGYTSWVGFWQLPDGRLRCDCRQVTGPKDKPISSVPVLESRDGGVTWDVLTAGTAAADSGTSGGYALSADSCRGMAISSDGTLVRGVWPSDMKDSGFVRRSTDGGKTWSDKIFFLPPDQYRTWPTLIRPLRDGRLVLFAGCWKRGDTSCGKRPDAIFADGLAGMLPNMTKMMFLSSDQGKTWSQPIVLMPTEVGVCEESDFCELSNGDLFWIHRTEHYPDHETAMPPMAARMGANPPDSYWYSDRLQSVVRKQGDTFVPDKCESAPFPHSGYPSVLLTREGVILHMATGESHWSTDVGKTWHKLLVDGKPLGTHYYPKTIQLADGRIVCIGHRGSDDVYGTVDQAVVQQTFRLKVQ